MKMTEETRRLEKKRREYNTKIKVSKSGVEDKKIVKLKRTALQKLSNKLNVTLLKNFQKITHAKKKVFGFKEKIFLP